jgi:hypothetical protein
VCEPLFPTFGIKSGRPKTSDESKLATCEFRWMRQACFALKKSRCEKYFPLDQIDGGALIGLVLV